MYFIGIDIGSTASKVAIRGKIIDEFVIPTGWNSKETALHIKNKLLKDFNINVLKDDSIIISTGYGRVSVPYSQKQITEITCHGCGIREQFDYDLCTIVDVGGQDTKVINLKDGFVDDFLMNDKCSAGTGKFLEIMANRLNITLDELFELSNLGEKIKISSMCTVFAESEIISLMGEGEKIENIASGIVDSVVVKVAQLVKRQGIQGDMILTGGLSTNKFFNKYLSEELETKINSYSKGRYAGAIGAALIAEDKYKKRGRV
ncbi:acyl-CoA dehydratase activase [Miniphocaeibacter halophilus]|uniref:CoA activase n=1 Tax=Miniphocaeibacter halophilus TaxID=2931922 RepID=A0AC61MQG1_9FIRM|nr:acyl-CoA dehydratase activase [Miniphocaeibacter halophilus]QQK07902.1 CoA activase [Miniphocaeibacter halophilus]